MWFRVALLSFCYFAVGNCGAQSDKVVALLKGLGTERPLEGSTRQEPIGFGTDDRRQGESISQNERFQNSQVTTGLGQRENEGSSKLHSGGSTFSQPGDGSSQHFNNRESEVRPGFSGLSSNNKENNQHSTGSRPNYQEHDRPTERPNTVHRETESQESGLRPSNNGESSFGRPVGGQTHSPDNREGEHRPSGSTPSKTGESSFGPYGRPTESSVHNSGHREHGTRPSESRPSSTGGSSFGRPLGGSSSGEHTSGSRPSNIGGSSFGRPTEGSNIGEHHSSGSRPSNTGENSFGQPTSSHTTGHREGEHHLQPSTTGESSFGSFGRPTEGSIHTTGHGEGGNRPSGFSPVTEGLEFGKPTGEFNPNPQTGKPDSHQEFGHLPTEHNQFSNKPEEHTGEHNEDKIDQDEDKDVCFTRLGCFKMGKPWKSILRPVGAPYGPEKIQTTIHFYSRDNLEKQKNITLHPEVNMGEVRFDPHKITAMIVHGFANSGNATWMKDMKNVYLKKVDANVMIVDWGKGAQLLNYLQVAGNTRVVGKQLSVFVKHLIDNYGADPGKFHLIGHSLGAQICSYLGKEIHGIARLTGLDPAQPAFEGFDSAVRLDKNDAEFVDVIHTDARPFIPTLGFGMIAPHGHVDFYMNGGFDQPGCVPPPKKELPTIKSFLDLAKYPVEVIAKTVACPHGRAYEYLTESFNETENCIFWGHKADVKNVFKSVTNTVTQGLLKKFTALSTTCSKEDCIPLGFATRKSPLRGVFVVTTNARPPYCISEPGIPPETPPEERKHQSYIQKIGRRTGLVH